MTSDQTHKIKLRFYQEFKIFSWTPRTNVKKFGLVVIYCVLTLNSSFLVFYGSTEVKTWNIVRSPERLWFIKTSDDWTERLRDKTEPCKSYTLPEFLQSLSSQTDGENETNQKHHVRMKVSKSNKNLNIQLMLPRNSDRHSYSQDKGEWNLIYSVTHHVVPPVIVRGSLGQRWDETSRLNTVLWSLLLCWRYVKVLFRR